ncbi:PHP domain-containing protein [Candidatus Woesearchaeota archaeon]|nr:PHP domain-containing protein [Candidatus Woesearchaeota archaeon]
MQLKVDLHTHSQDDPVDKIRHTSRELVNLAVRGGYAALAITNHTDVFYSRDLDRLAEDHGLGLIPGMEANVNGKHVLLYCLKERQVIDELNRMSRQGNGDLSFDQVAALKERGIVTFVMAPHPYYLLEYCLGSQLAAHHDLFDLIEVSPFHTNSPLPKSWASWDFLNRNKMAEVIAHRFGIPLFASSDAHDIRKFGKAHSLVEAEPTLDSIVSVLQSRDQRKIEPITKPLSLFRYVADIPMIYFS